MIDWKLAPEGAVELKYSKSDCSASWFNNKGEHWFEDCWMNVTFPDDWQTISTRPTQTKTVADAVEHYGGVWPSDVEKIDKIKFDKKCGEFFPDFGEACSKRFEVVCTRDEFEAYVKEQEGEKWTHVYTDDTGTDIRCRLLAEHGEWAWIEDAGAVDTISRSWLKPIKPTISESEMMQRIKYRAISIDDDDEFGSKVRAWLDEYEII